jgi:integrase
MGFVEPTKFKWVVDSASGRRIKKGTRDAKWKASYTDPSGRDRSRTFARKLDAEKFLERVGTEMQKGEWLDPKANKTRFEDWVNVWWKTTVKLAPSTRRGYDKVLRNQLLPQFRGRKITSIDWVEVELFATSLLERDLSAKTVRETLSVLSQVMKTAVRARALRENPAAGHSMPTRRQRTPVLTMEQVDRLVSHTDERYRTAVWLLALAGLRPSELCGLRVMDIDWDSHTVSVNEVQMWVKGELVVKGPKTVSGLRTIPLPEWLIDELRDHLDKRAAAVGRPMEPTDRAYVSPRGKAMLDHTLWRIVNRACDAAGLGRIRPYDLRHSHASLLIDIGAHPKAISERMGHTEIGVTMNVYGHLFEGKQRELTSDLNDLLRRTRSKKRPAHDGEASAQREDENDAT